jgi:hypothetical protein
LHLLLANMAAAIPNPDGVDPDVWTMFCAGDQQETSSPHQPRTSRHTDKKSRRYDAQQKVLNVVNELDKWERIADEAAKRAGQLRHYYYVKSAANAAEGACAAIRRVIAAVEAAKAAAAMREAAPKRAYKAALETTYLALEFRNYRWRYYNLWSRANEELAANGLPPLCK